MCLGRCGVCQYEGLCRPGQLCLGLTLGYSVAAQWHVGLSRGIVIHLPGAQHPVSAQDPFLGVFVMSLFTGKGTQIWAVSPGRGLRRDRKSPTFFWLPGLLDSWPLNSCELCPPGLLKAMGSLILKGSPEKADSLPEVTKAHQLQGPLLASHPTSPPSPFPATLRHREDRLLLERDRNTKWWD